MISGGGGVHQGGVTQCRECLFEVLPLQEFQAPQYSPPRAPRIVMSNRKMTALIVDDSAIMRRIVISTLRRLTQFEFEFVEARDGVEGLEVVEVSRPDIIFCDWKMPKMDGMQFVIRVRSEPSLTLVPIVMVSEEKSIGKIDDALNRVRVSAYITKPFTFADFKRQAVPLLQKIASSQEPTGEHAA